MPVTFAQLGVPEQICAGLERRGITEPFEIQAKTVADAMAGKDVCGRAPTGSGKTLAFGVPLVANIERAKPKRPRGLVLAPTRELAQQIAKELRSFAGPIRIGVVYGGVGYGPQFKALREGVEILVACPGRLEDLIEQGECDLSSVDRVVLDEADRMADMGFMPAVRRLLDQTAKKRQTVLFSATLDGDVAKLTRDYQKNPVRHEVGEETPDITSAHHVFWNVAQPDRMAITAEAVNAVWPAIIFTRTRHGADRLAKQLGRADIKAVAIHGGRSQGQRTRALEDFTKGRVHAMVATDVAARGIHVDGVASVIHYDPPEDHKTYVHRSGRTARAGEGGVVVSLVQPSQKKDANKVQQQVGLKEPFIDPDAAALRELSNAPARELAPAVDRSQPSGPGSGSGRPGRHRSGNKSGRPNRGSGGGGSRSGGPKGNGAKRKKPGNSSSGNSSSGNSSGGAGGGGGQGRSSRSGSSNGAKAGGNGPKSNGAKAGGRRKKARSDNAGPNRKQRRAHLQNGT